MTQTSFGGQEQPPRFLTTEEVVAYLRVNAHTVYRLIQSGDLPGVRVGRQWRFRRQDIEAWLDGQRQSRGDLSAQGLPERTNGEPGIENSCTVRGSGR
jgi:excisionase family DNA binding protein